ncbi:MAG: citrate/2-methylcitrate synthase [Planctomycetota bacterium]
MRATEAAPAQAAAPQAPSAIYAPGLEGVIAAETSLSRVDGERGQLVLRGHEVEDLAGRASFEQVVALLWTGDLDGLPGLARALGRARVAAHARLALIGDALEREDGMDALRAALAHGLAEGGEHGGVGSAADALGSGPGAAGSVAESSPSAAGSAADALGSGSATADQREAWATSIGILGALPVYVAGWWRRQAGLAPVAPDPTLGHAADYLRLLRGAPASEAEARALDAYLVTVIDHGFNASTFAARVVASTWSDPVSAVVAAVGALKGPLHGGAPGPVLDMLDAIAAAPAPAALALAANAAGGESARDGARDEARAEAWVRAELAAGRRIMGMGHRVYRVRDPRAAVLERAVGELAAPRLPLARAAEAAAARVLGERKPGRALAANVELYTALLLDAVGLDRRLFTPTFAVARGAGWLAHVREQRESGRLIRPRARYVGPEPQGAAGAAREAVG